MANKDRPMGFAPVGEVKQTMVAVVASAVYAGEFVAMANTGTVAAATAGCDIFGLALSTQATVGGKVLLSVDPEQIYVGQADETEINEQSDIGNICDIVATAESSTYKHARMEIDSSTSGTGSGGQLVILGLMVCPDNAFGGYAKVLVKINEHQAFGTDDFGGI
jgi:hypothetical protein